MGSSDGLILARSTVSLAVTLLQSTMNADVIITIVKEHVAIIIMSSTAANSATAIQVISVQDRKYYYIVSPSAAGY